MPGIDKIRDIALLTRDTELEKNAWVSISSDLPSYPFHSTLVPRQTRNSSFTYAWTLTIGTPNGTHYSEVNDPLQVSTPAINRRVSVRLSKIRRAISFARDEDELQGTDEEMLLDVVMQRKTEQLDQHLLSFQEHKLAGAGGTSSSAKQEILGLKFWVPGDTSATDLLLNATVATGGDPTGFTAGAAGVSVADVPRWGNAQAGFSKVSDDDLFDKINEFLIRVNYHTPDGARTIDSAIANRCILCQHPVYLTWARLQTTANDDLRNDLGAFRGSINFMSIPVKNWHVISTPGSPEAPTDHGLVYVLDLNTFTLVTHSAFNFDLETGTDTHVPGVVYMWREGYEQLLCTNREKNLVLTTTNTDLYLS